MCTSVEIAALPAMPEFVMQKILPEPASDELVARMRPATEACFEINDMVRRVTYASAGRLRFVCVMEARDRTARRRMDPQDDIDPAGEQAPLELRLLGPMDLVAGGRLSEDRSTPP